jgi:hypothetical protein
MDLICFDIFNIDNKNIITTSQLLKSQLIENKPMNLYQNWDRILAYFWAALTFGLSLTVYQQIQLLGFPDGYLTELDRAERVLGNIFFGINILAGMWFGFLGWEAARQRINRKLTVSIISHGIFVLIVYSIGLYLAQNLNSGGGG